MRCTSARDSVDEIQRSFRREDCARPRAMRQHKLAVERERGFERHQGLPRDDPLRECFVQTARLRFAQSDADFNPRRAQLLEAASGHRGIGIGHRRHDARDACGDQRIRARAGASRVAARFEVDVERRAARGFARCFQRDDFRVTHAVVGVKSLADNFALRAPGQRQPWDWGWPARRRAPQAPARGP